MDIVQAVAQVPTSNDPLNRPLYEVHINSITIREYVTAPVQEESKVEGISAISMSISALTIILTAIALSRKRP